LAGFLVLVDFLKVRIEHFPHQASVFLYVSDNDEGGLWTTRTSASQTWITTWARRNYQFWLLHAHRFSTLAAMLPTL
jgi:hypothetical protein